MANPEPQSAVLETNIESNESFSCPRCGYTTMHRPNMKKHLERKRPCPASLEDISLEEISSIYPHLFQKHTNKPFACEWCPARFTGRHALSRHRGHFCQHKPSQTAQEAIQSEISELRQRLDELEQSASVTVNASSSAPAVIANSHNTNCNNTQNTTNYVQNVQNQQNVQIFAFGRQSVDHLLEDTRFMNQCLKRREKGLAEFVQRLHYDADHPENHNVKATNPKSAYVKTFDGERWIWSDKEQVLNELLEEGCNGFDTHYEEHKDTLSEHLSETMMTLIDEFMNKLKDCEPHVQFAKELKQRIFLTLLNGTVLLQ